MAGLERDYWPCPFCDKGMLEVLIRPRTVRIKKAYGGYRSGKSMGRAVREESVIDRSK